MVKTKIISALAVAMAMILLLAACGTVEKNISADDDHKVDVPDVQSPEADPVLDAQATEAEEEAEPEEPEEKPEEEPVYEEEDLYEEVEWMKQSAAQKIVDTAIAQLGKPYTHGGDDPEEGFDSTGFTYYCAKEAGISFPRSLKDQLEYGEKISYDELAAGDIVYFSQEVGSDASFCGVYVGGGLIIYSPVPDDFVKTANITTNYWVTHFVTGLRITNAEN